MSKVKPPSTLSAAKITSGTFDVARMPNLSADIITSGSIDVARIPDLNSSKIINLPTSDPNTSGEIWNDNGTVKVSR